MKSIQVNSTLTFAIILMFTSSNYVSAKPEEVWNTLGSFFSGNCANHGYLTSQAKAKANETAQMLATIKSKAPCAPQAPLISDIEQRLEQLKKNAEKADSNKNNIEDLQSAIIIEKSKSPQDLEYIKRLQTQLNLIKAEFISKKINSDLG